MNAQPSETISSLTALLFMCMIAYFLFTNKSKSINTGLFHIGYIEDPIVHPPSIVINNPINSVPQVDNSLLKDCVDTLVALGFKKKSATKVANDIFKLHNPTTIQQFLSFALKK